MCKISYEKCICFIFLIVILVVLICSGFPIDNVAMPNTSKKNFRTSSSRSADFFNRKSTNTLSSHHRQRHLRQLRAQTRDTPPTGHIEATVFQNDATTSKLYAQVPSSLTKTINTRSQRSSSNSRHRSKDCQPEHYSTKAYKSQIVLRVKVQGIERTNYTVSFKLIESLKNPSSFPIHEYLTLQFSNHTGNNCDKGRRGRKNHLVKADIKASQEYILFLNASSANKCSPSYSPELVPAGPRKQREMMRILKKVCNSKVKPTKIPKLEDKSSWKRSKETKKKKLKLLCRASGLPFPRITWRRNNATIGNSTRVSISYVKRRSKLEIPEPTQDDFGTYECVARGVDGTAVSRSIEVLGPPAAPQNSFSEPVSTKRECNETYTEAFCMGHGKCFTDYNNQVYCECKDGYIGQRCEEKTPPHPAKRHLHVNGRHHGHKAGDFDG